MIVRRDPAQEQENNKKSKQVIISALTCDTGPGSPPRRVRTSSGPLQFRYDLGTEQFSGSHHHLGPIITSHVIGGELEAGNGTSNKDVIEIFFVKYL